jgi:Ca2+-binding EF-hand superfamily protein
MGNKGGKKVPPKQKLSSKDIKNLAKQSGMDKEEIQTIFDQFIENNPDGSLDRAEFIRLYDVLRPESGERLDEVSQFVFGAFDADNSGKIQFSEFLVSYALTSHGEPEEKLQYAFDFYDEDNNNFLTGEELKGALFSMLDLLGAEKKEYDIEQLANECLEQLDTTEDNRIESHEFISGLMANYSLRALMSPFN